MKEKIAILLMLVVFGCTNQPQIDISELEGYWEIEFVEQKGEVFSNNQKTPLYDFYSVDKNSGVYKKVAPQFDGNFQTSESSVAFEISEEKGIFKLNFSTPWNRWQKEIKVLNAERLVLYHQERNFNYKRVKFEKSTLAK